MSTASLPIAAPAGSRTPTAGGHPTAVLAIILVSYFMVILDISVVLTGLPQIREELGFADPRSRRSRPPTPRPGS